MAIDPIADPLISLSRAAKSLPNPPSPACLWRWHARGIRGVRLETVVVGGRRFTTAAAFREFVERLTVSAAATGKPESPPPRLDDVQQKLRAHRLI
ncbi:MAG TPA: DUF1580 domain-containing protein [Planctomycetaceae bacterium]|jgi:hypothetical protein|nr:DUF1580 domain-containing protein [Planctomycetaceae bacterium]